MGVVGSAPQTRLAQYGFIYQSRNSAQVNLAWSQVVHVFQVAAWEGNPAESIEMKPVWFGVNQLPFEQMWQDAPHWLPRILVGEPIRMRFAFEDDNETIREVHREASSTDD
jgi:hypothetical protein